jgi:hypothetical protein
MKDYEKTNVYGEKEEKILQRYEHLEEMDRLKK